MPPETTNPQSFADLITSPAYPTWAKPEPADNPTKHRKTYTFLRSIAAQWDGIVTAAKSAAYCHGSQTAPPDALDALAETYGGLIRAIKDTDETFRAYLKAPLSRWYRFGTKAGLLGELEHLGYPRAQVVSWRDLVDAGAGMGNVVFGGNTTFFFVAIYQPNVFSQVQGLARWKNTHDRWQKTHARWGAGITLGNPVAELRYIISLVKPAHTSCRHIVVFLDSMSGLNAQLLPTGNYTVIPMNEPWERIRPTYAFRDYYIQNPLVEM